LKKDGRILLGAVGTQNRFMTRYGYFECRAQLQKSPGIWAAFWIQSTEISKGEDPAIYGAEIDILEFFKKPGTDIVSHNVHWAYGPHQKTTFLPAQSQEKRSVQTALAFRGCCWGVACTRFSGIAGRG
jgi:beta-glucanase (GH16 family)